jgi:hypothetical protein
MELDGRKIIQGNLRREIESNLFNKDLKMKLISLCLSSFVSFPVLLVCFF